jgi:hypothetical protein
MNLLTSIVVVGVLLSGSAGAAELSEKERPHPWVLLGLDLNMDAVTWRDTATDADTISIYGEGLPVFETKAACQVALRHAIQKYTGRSHEEGNLGHYLCTNYDTWTSCRGEKGGCGPVWR